MNAFKLYDIRGVYGKDLTDEIIFKIGLAIGKYFENTDTIGIINDIRIHSERIKKIIISSLLHTHNIIDFGIGSTPEACYLARVYTIPILVITASHNPKEYNGIKIISDKGLEIFPEELRKIENIYKDIRKPSEKIGKIEEEKTAIEIYKWYLRKKFRDVKGYKIGYDSSNSVMSLFKDVFVDLGNEIYSINDKLDGNFPAHPPDPSDDKNMSQMINLVKNKKLDFGLVFDGDGDRVGIVDNNGRILRSYEYLLAFLDKNRRFLIEISLPLFIRELLKNKGFEIFISRTGRPFIIKKCFEKNIFLAVEYSNHFYFSENFYVSDSLYAVLRLLKEMNKRKINFEDLKVPKFYFESFSIDKKRDIVSEIREYLKDKKVEINNLNGELDGFEFIGNGFRILIRESQTEPKYRIILEYFIDEEYIRNIFSHIKEKILG